MSSEFKIIFRNGIVIEECQETILFSFGELLKEGIREVLYFTVFNGLPDLNSLKILDIAATLWVYTQAQLWLISFLANDQSYQVLFKLE